MAWAVTARKSLGGQRAATWGTNPELPAYEGAFAGDATRKGVDDWLDDIEAFAQERAQQRIGYVVPGYLNGLAPSVVGGQLQIDTGACVVDGWWCPNESAVYTTGAASNGTWYFYIDPGATGVPTPSMVLSTDYVTLAALQPICIICEFVRAGGVITSVTDLRHLNTLASGSDLWPALRTMADHMGGEGIYSGGADVIGDFSSGKYPAASMIVYDDRGGAIPTRWTAPVTVGVSHLAASGTYNLYAVVVYRDNDPQAPGQTGWQAVDIEAYDNGTAAPANSFLLGSGTYTGASLDTFTIDASARVAAGASLFARRTLAETISGNWTHTGDLIVTNGQTRIVRDTKFGPPASGTYAIGDLWLDLGGAVWYCTVAGTPGTWVQQTPGTASVWTGGGAGDITATGQWNGAALLDGYQVFDTAGEVLWIYDTGISRWKSDAAFQLNFTPREAVPVAATTNPFYVPLDSEHDYLIERIGWLVTIAGTPDGGNYWTLQIRNWAGTAIGSVQTYNSATIDVRYVEAVSAVQDTATALALLLTATKTGSPDVLTPTPFVWARKVRN